MTAYLENGMVAGAAVGTVIALALKSKFKVRHLPGRPILLCTVLGMFLDGMIRQWL
jgi:hypothetical protein